MAEVRPFRGLRFDPSRVPDLSRVVCPPYDVISPEMQRALHERDPYNMVRLELGYASSDAEGGDRYSRAAQTLDRWLQSGVLVQETDPALYLHRVTFRVRGQERTRRELLALVRLEEWDRRVVLPHERTMAEPKADRLNLLRATGANLSPVFGLYEGAHPSLEKAWRLAEGHAPAAEYTDDDSSHHLLWAITGPEVVEPIVREFVGQPIFIADGHHRYETALRYRDERRAQATDWTGEEPWNFVMMVLVAADDPGLVVLPTHRLLRGLKAMDLAAVEARLSAHFQLELLPVPPGTPEERAARFMELVQANGRAQTAYGMLGPGPGPMALLVPRDGARRALPAHRSEAWQALDVALLDTLAITPLLEDALLPREQALGYTRDEVEAFLAVDSGSFQLAFLLKATPVHQVLAVASAGDRMPEKSTYFYPKPPTGLVLHLAR